MEIKFVDAENADLLMLAAKLDEYYFEIVGEVHKPVSYTHLARRACWSCICARCRRRKAKRGLRGMPV